jgi:hypothetical protein
VNGDLTGHHQILAQLSQGQSNGVMPILRLRSSSA